MTREWGGNNFLSPKSRRCRGPKIPVIIVLVHPVQGTKDPHIENRFLTFRTIRERLGADVSYDRYLHHLRILKQKGSVHKKFGGLASKRLEKAYAIYFEKSLPVSKIEKIAGVKNFASTLRRHRKSGWDVPPPLFVYRGKVRSRIVTEANERRLRESKGGNAGAAPNP